MRWRGDPRISLERPIDNYFKMDGQGALSEIRSTRKIGLDGRSVGWYFDALPGG